MKDANKPKLGKGKSDVAAVAPGFDELEDEDEERCEGRKDANHRLCVQLSDDCLGSNRLKGRLSHGRVDR